MVRVLIADDHEVVRTGLEGIIETHPGWRVVAIARDGKEAIDKAFEAKPDVAVVDYALPLFNGVEVTRRIRAQLPRTEVIIFTMHDNETLILDLLRAGARGYLLKTDANRHLIPAIKALSNHRPYFTSPVPEGLMHLLSARPGHGGTALTDRERQVVQLIAEGHSNKVVSRLLDISLKTVETHRAAVMRKLKLSSSAGLVRYAVRNKIIEP